MKLVIALDVKIAREEMHRMCMRILILLFFARVVIYMRVHPRIAILYSTLLQMSLDFMHFLILFCTLYVVLAFLAMWSFGDFMPDFASLQIACYTQFRMIVGEFNLPSGKNSGTIASIAVYYIIYFLMVFSLLLNFFLA